MFARKMKVSPDLSKEREEVNTVDMEGRSDLNVRMTNRYYPLSYKEPAEMQDFHEIVDSHLKALFEKEIDEGNIDVLLTLCSDLGRKGILDVKRQRVNRIRGIDNVFVGNESGKKRLSDKIAAEKSMVEQLQAQANEIRKRIEKNKFRKEKEA